MQKALLTSRDDFFTVRDFLTAAECENYIALSEAAGYGEAPISTYDGPRIVKEMRSNNRVMIDDPALAADLWVRLAPLVPAERGRWRAHGLNERIRFYRYDPGQQFDWHFDAPFERNQNEISDLTFMVYLSGGYTGGSTDFNFTLTGTVRDDDPHLTVAGAPGMALVFKHRVLHRGAAVESGRKYVLRSDVMYRWDRSSDPGELTSP